MQKMWLEFASPACAEVEEFPVEQTYFSIKFVKLKKLSIAF